MTMFEGDERFNAIERSREREDLFENYFTEFRKKVGFLSLYNFPNYSHYVLIHQTIKVLYCSYSFSLNRWRLSRFRLGWYLTKL